MGRICIQDLKMGMMINHPFLVKGKYLRYKKTGEPYLALLLGDRTGEMNGILWEGFQETDRTIHPGDFVMARGITGSFQGTIQLNISRIQRLSPEEVRPEEFYPSTSKDVEGMVSHLREVAGSFTDPHLKTLLNSFLEDESFLPSFKRSTAAKSLHHVFWGGLLEHTLSVVKICQFIMVHYDGIWGDLLLTGAALHDVGKVHELTFERGAADYTDEGRLLGHIMIGAQMVNERILSIPDFPPPLEMQLLHILVSHHGDYIWGSPKRPKTIEALIVHHVEDLDAKVMGFQHFMNHSKDPDRPHWTSYHKVFDRYLYLGNIGTEDEMSPGGV